MRRGSSFGRRLVLALLLSLPAAACTDELPTLSGEEFFPGGVRPSTFEVVVPAERFLQDLGEFTGFSGPRDANYLVVAHRFGGVLEAHALGRLADFPTTITYSQGGTSKTDSVFTFVQGSVLAAVDSSATALDGPVRLQLWELAQEWDYGTVSWELAVDTAGVRVPWATPGGTRGALLSEVTLSSLGGADTLRFPLDTTVLRRISRKEVPGFLVTATGGPARVQLNELRLRAEVRPQGASPDTVVQVNVGAASEGQTFVFTPEPPTSAAAWEAGGIRSARTLFRIDLETRVPGCASGCPDLPLDSVTLNEVSLLLRPVPVPQGFRPLAPVPLLVRRVVEPELGRRAPLGDIVNEVVGRGAGGQPIFAGSVVSPGDSLLAVPITAFAAQLIAADTSASTDRTATLALLGDPEAATFGPAWFEGSPRLRIVYTVPVRPTLP